MTEKEARHIISLMRPSAKFGGYSHTDEFLDLEAQIGKGFFYVSVYDEEINSNLIEGKKGVILLSNSYLSSSAYNILLAWLFENRNGRIDRGQINPVLKYNVKKFYSEQLIHYYNNTFSRAIFLETLLYEQQLMKPVFNATDSASEWATAASAIANLMGSLLMGHELGHYYQQYLPHMYGDLVQHNDKAVRPILDAIGTEYPERFNDEVRCDIFSILFLLVSDKGDKATTTFMLRAVVLGYSIFALLWSLQKSASATADAHKMQPDEIVLWSFEKSTRQYTYVIGRYSDMIERSKVVTSLCESIARDRGVNLYGDDGLLPLHENVLEYFLGHIETFMENDDTNQRNMARLMAESLHQHPDGLQYLYLHSKIFKSNNPLKL